MPKTLEGAALIREVGRQRRKVDRLRDTLADENRRLGSMLQQVRADSSPDATLVAAAAEMGVTKQTVNYMLAQADKADA